MSTLREPTGLAGGRVPADAPRIRRSALPLPSGYGAVVAVSLLLAAASLAFASSPSYDPWAWLIWGREVIHLDLVTFGGPTWKPLPVLFTTVFALFGSAAPMLWLLVARAGGIAGLVLAGWLAFRLVRLGNADLGASRRVTRDPGAWAAALAGLAGVFMLYQYLASTASGESEGLLVALCLAAVMRHLDGSRRQALALGFAAALIRPETWPFLALYAAWLWMRDSGARRLITAIVLLIPALWFLPELWGSGSALRGVNWARYPRTGSAAFARCPFCTELSAHGWPLLLPAFKVGVALAVVACLPWPRKMGRSLSALVLAAVGVAWILEEAVLTQIGFTGSDRYLIAPEALLIVVGAVGWGLTVRRLGNRILGAVAIVGCLGLLVVLAPEPGPHLGTLARTERVDSGLQADMHEAVLRAGGARRLLRCGPIEANPSEAPLAAWTLGAPLRATEATRGAVVIQSGSAQDPRLLPAAPARSALLAAWGAVRIFGRCG